VPKAQSSVHVPLWVHNSHQEGPQSLTLYGFAKYVGINPPLLENVEAGRSVTQRVWTRSSGRDDVRTVPALPARFLSWPRFPRCGSKALASGATVCRSAYAQWWTSDVRLAYRPSCARALRVSLGAQPEVRAAPWDDGDSRQYPRQARPSAETHRNRQYHHRGCRRG